jgi:hypothetical protein
MLLITGLSSVNYSSGTLTSRLRVDSTIRIAQLRPVLKCLTQWPMWCKLIAPLVICAPVAFNEQILPQLVAQIASLDHDHGVSLHVTNKGVDLVLTHDAQAVPTSEEAKCLALSSSQPAHVLHFANGHATTKQSGARTLTPERQIAVYFSIVITTEWRTFVPQMPLAYSRPPPDEMSILPAHRSTLLLI